MREDKPVFTYLGEYASNLLIYQARFDILDKNHHSRIKTDNILHVQNKSKGDSK